MGRIGVPVYCIDAVRWEPTFSSRYCRGRFVRDIEQAAPPGALSYLLKVAKKVGGRPVLVPTTDSGAIWVSQNATSLQASFRFQFQDVSLVRMLCDKSRMQELARRCGVPTAASTVPKSKEDVIRFIEATAFPIVVKALDAERLRPRAGGTKFVVQSARELLNLYTMIEDREQPNLLLQEFIPGEDWMFNGYFDQNSECMFGITGKKIRRFPVNTGVTSLGICLNNETVKSQTAGFMKSIGYKGILDIGYRFDPRCGLYKVLDVNPRIGCTFRLFTAINGMDVARALYLHLTGQQIEPSHVADGRKWIVEDFDMVSALHCWRDHTITFMEWIASLHGIQEMAWFAVDDPVPFLLMPLADIWELLRWHHVSKKAHKVSKSHELECAA